MTSEQLQAQIESWANSKNFTAPYGVLTGKSKSKSGRPYLSVTFGRARTLDAEVQIYSKTFIILRTSRTGSEVYRSVDELQKALDLL